MDNGQIEQRLPWYALRIKPNFEKQSSRMLREGGYEEFLPLYRSRRKWADRVKELELPLFPGYLFCRLDLRRRVPVLNTPGVLEVVSLGRCVAEVPEPEIEVIRRMVASRLRLEPWPLLQVGDRVRLDQGPLAGVEGILVAVKGYRLVVSVPLLRRSIAAEVDAQWVRPVARRVSA